MGLRLKWIVRIEDLKNVGKGNRVLQSGCSLTVEDFLSHRTCLLLRSRRGLSWGWRGWPCRGDLFLLDY
jgi:hypothetical protein